MPAKKTPPPVSAARVLVGDDWFHRLDDGTWEPEEDGLSTDSVDPVVLAEWLDEACETIHRMGQALDA